MSQNVLLIGALAIFAFIVLRIYFVFLLNNTPKEPDELSLDEVLSRGIQLYEDNMYLELQRFLKKELVKKYRSTELRKLLAKSYVQSSNNRMAIAHLETVLKLDPTDTEAKEILADAYMEEGYNKKAVAIFEEILKTDPANLTAIKNLARLYTSVGLSKQAIKMYSMYIEAEDNPQTQLDIHTILASLYNEEGNYKNAIKEYEILFEADPGCYNTIITLAELNQKVCDWQKSLEYYLKARELKGEDPEISEKIAQTYFNLDEMDKAKQEYLNLIENEDKNDSHYLHHQNMVAEILINQGNAQESIDILTSLIKEFPKEDSLAFTLAQAHMNLGNYEEAVNLYEDLIVNLPPDQTEIIRKHISNLISNWAMDIFNEGKYNQAFDKFFSALKYDENNADVYYKLGRCNCEIKSFTDAIAHFKRAIAISPQESSYYMGLGYASDELGDLKGAKNAFSDAINIDPLNPKAHNALGIVLAKEFNLESAIKEFNEVLKFTPNDADVMYNIALAYEMLDNREKAEEFYKAALKVSPEHEEAGHNLSLLLGYDINNPSGE